jgi:hypothetical protein
VIDICIYFPIDLPHVVSLQCLLLHKLWCWCIYCGIAAGCFSDRAAQRYIKSCRGKFGEAGARVFNLLAGGGQQLEQRTVSERAMLPLKLARELLYRMLKARYVSLQVGAHVHEQHLLSHSSGRRSWVKLIFGELANTLGRC